MSTQPIRNALTVIAVAFTCAASAQQPRTEVVLTGLRFPCLNLPLGGPYPALLWHQFDTRTSIDRVASAPGQPVYGVTFTGSVAELQPDLSERAFAPARAGNLFAIAVTPNGRVFTTSHTGSLWAYSADGVHEASHSLPGYGGQGALAAAADECTVYYTKRTDVASFNVCTGEPLIDFAPAPSAVLDIAALPNGQVLLSTAGAVFLYGPSGAMIRAVYGGAPDQIATTPDGDLWVAETTNNCDGVSRLLRVSFTDGHVISESGLPNMAATSLVVAYARLPDAPTVSGFTLLLLSLALAFGGVFLLRR